MRTKLTQGARLLKTWLAAGGSARTQDSLAKDLGTTQPSISTWLRGARPEDHVREAIEVLTGIPRESWRKPDEQGIVDRVRAKAGASQPTATTRAA